jgi:uncharacterized protein
LTAANAPAVAVMAKVPGAAPVKSRLHAALTAVRATDLYRCFLLDRLDALAAVPDITRVVAFTPPEARVQMAALAPPGFRLVAQEGSGLSERLPRLFDRLLADGHPAVLAMDSDSPTLPMAYVTEAARALLVDEADLVVGPSDDGGYYLIGLRAPRPELVVGGAGGHAHARSRYRPADATAAGVVRRGHRRRSPPAPDGNGDIG